MRLCYSPSKTSVSNHHVMCRITSIGRALALFIFAASFVGAAETSEGNVQGKIMPQLISQSPPVLPPSLAHVGIGGVVEVAFTVDEKGRIVDPVVTKTSDRRLNPYALKSLADWRFVPGAKDGQITAFRLKATIDFSKKPEAQAPASGAAPKADDSTAHAKPNP